MPDEPQAAKRSGRGRRPAPAWLRLATVCVLLVVVPVAVYLFVYQRQRVEQATIRNFRALDAAAERVVEVMERLPGVVEGSSFGISPTMLDEVTERVSGRRTGCTSDEGIGPPAWGDDIELPDGFFACADRRRRSASTTVTGAPPRFWSTRTPRMEARPNGSGTSCTA